MGNRSIHFRVVRFIKEITMNVRQLSFPLSGQDHAVLTLPQPVARETLGVLEHALSTRLRQLQREMCGAADDPGQIEYASWLRQPDTPRH